MSQWDCDKCTFLNSVDDLTCTMCFQVRASTRALPFTWQWLAQVDWIPYDAPSNQQIEAAFKDGQEKVDLNRGWFASKRGEYTVHFGRRTAKAEKAARGAVAAARARRDADEDDDEDGSDAEEDGEEERAVGACGSSGGAGHAAPAAHASATLPAFTQVNNHSRMVRKVRRVSERQKATLRPLNSSHQADRFDTEPRAAAVGAFHASLGAIGVGHFAVSRLFLRRSLPPAFFLPPLLSCSSAGR